MSDCIKITPRKLSGIVSAPPSKSVAHRAILCAALSSGDSKILKLSYSDDIRATLSAVSALGAKITDIEGGIEVSGVCKVKKLDNIEIDCNESGSTLRFIIPVALAIGGKISLTGKGRLMERPLDDYFKIFDKDGISYTKKGNSLCLDGKLKGGRYELSGNVSSQYITGLLYGLSMLSVDSEIFITTPLESAAYVEMTIDTMSKFGISIEKSSDLRHFVIKGNQKYESGEYCVEGDFSQAAFYFVANAIGNNIEINGLSDCSAQGDKEIVSIVEEMRTAKSEHTIDVSQVPDLVPILAVLATQTEGITHIVGAKRLRIKESDRLSAISEELRKLGAKIEEKEDSLTIFGKTQLHGGELTAHNDHRIAMSVAIASTVATENITLSGYESVRKSYPDFWEKFQSLGGEIKYVQ